MQVVNAPHKAELSHELIAAAASYEVRIPASRPSRAALTPPAPTGREGVREALRGQRQAPEPRGGQGAPRGLRRRVRRPHGRDQGRACLASLVDIVERDADDRLVPS